MTKVLKSRRLSKVFRKFSLRKKKSPSGESTSSDSTSNESTSNKDNSPPRTRGRNPADKNRRVSQGQAYRQAMADAKVLVYHYRAERKPVIPHGLAIITYQELTDILVASMSSFPHISATQLTKLADPMLQLSKKPIPHLALSIDIYQHDLHTASQDAAEPAGTHPNDGSNVASVIFPIRIAFGEAAAIDQGDKDYR